MTAHVVRGKKKKWTALTVFSKGDFFSWAVSSTSKNIVVSPEGQEG